MSIVSREAEIAVRINEPTEISAVALLGWHPDVQVLAMRSYCDRDGVVLLVVTTNATKAAHILESAGFRCKANPVLLIGPLGRSGLAAPIGLELARAGIEVLYSYSSRKDREAYFLVFKTTEDVRAMRALALSPTIRQAINGDILSARADNRLGLSQQAA